MSTQILATKLYMPAPRPRVVPRPWLIERLDAGLDGKLTLISAAAGFGKTTLVSEWVAALQTSPLPLGEGPGVRAAWLSLDEGDSDPTRFLTYLIAALQTVAPSVGQGALAALQAPQPPSPEAILTAVLNDLAALPDRLLLVLDDYHAVDAPAVDQAVAFLLDYLPPTMHLVIASREDPPLPLARLRARGQLTELRAADLRFTPAEAAQFLNEAMGLNLSEDEITALEARTEGWIAGLHLAALSLHGRADTASFVEAFSGSHRFVLDYLVEEVLHQQPAGVQDFLLRTAVLDRLCGPLCDAVMQHAAADGQETLAALERANLFIVPLDDERRWYRYHHLFGELLRQRLHQQHLPAEVIASLHIRASAWYEANDLEMEAFQHAAAAHDIDRAERLLEGRGMPLLFRGAARPILSWLASLPGATLDAHPSLWVTYASALLFIQQVAGVEEKLQAAEAALAGIPQDARTRDLVGHIASIRATVAVTQHDVATILAQSQRALDYLHPRNLPVRTAARWSLAYAYHLLGDRATAGRAYAEAMAASQAMGHFIIQIMATLGLAHIQECDTHLHLAAETYRRALELAGDPPLPVACAAHLGLARISYAWNDLAAAGQHGQQSLHLARQIANTDRSVGSELFLVRLKLAQGDLAGATGLLATAGQQARQHGFALQLPEVAALETLLALRQGQVAAAAEAARRDDIPLCRARVELAQGDGGAALTTLAAYRQQADARGWTDERLKAMILQALAYQARGEGETAARLLIDALKLAEPAGFMRVFVDEGPPMAQLVAEAAARGAASGYTARLLAAFGAEQPLRAGKAPLPAALPLIEPLSERELEVLLLIAQGLSNQEIGERLFLALDSVKGHNRRIFDKLQVQRRTEAVARARELGLI
jgi:LuxR family maltose regulon positive regulatory protein